jgi:hypothetical protein
MKSFKTKGLFRPFEGLKTLLEAKSVPLKKDNERITQNICAKQNSQKSNVAGSDKTDESETLLQLQELVETGKGFVVADTPEYVEGIGYHVNREVAKRLHNGEFSIPAKGLWLPTPPNMSKESATM